MYSSSYYVGSDPVVGMVTVGIMILIVAFVCNWINNSDSGQSPRNYSNISYDFYETENYNWDDSWDDKWLHQGEYADNTDIPESTDYDPSWDEHFRD